MQKMEMGVILFPFFVLCCIYIKNEQAMYNSRKINRIIKEEIDKAIDDIIDDDYLNDEEYDDLMSRFSDDYDEEDRWMEDELYDPDAGKYEFDGYLSDDDLYRYGG